MDTYYTSHTNKTGRLRSSAQYIETDTEKQPKWEDKKQKPYERIEQRSRNNGVKQEVEELFEEIMRSNNLTDAEFKTLVIKMFNELLGKCRGIQ